MSQSTMAALTLALVLGVLGFAFWYSQQHPRQIVGTSIVSVRSERAGGGVTVHKTRDISVNGVVFQEVELPNGTWIDCAGDCASAVRDAGEDFYDKRQRERP